MGQEASQLSGYDDAADPTAPAADSEWTADSGAAGADAADGATEDTEQIRARIEETRGQMSQTIDAIQEKLSPERLKEQAQEMVHDATIGRAETMVNNATEQARGFGSGLMETIRQNPVPAAIAGIGLGWLFMKRPQGSSNYGGRGQDNYNYPSRSGYGYGYGTGADQMRYGQQSRSSYGYGSGASQDSGGVGQVVGQAKDTVGQIAGQAGDTVGQAGEKVGEVAGQVGSKVGDVAEGAQQKVGELGDQAQYQAQRAGYWFQDTLQSNPLVVGAVALALGAAVGLAVPETPQEHRLLGEARDNLMDKAQNVAQETAQKVQRVASEVTDTAQQAAKDEGLAPQTAGGAQASV
jgi:ElaB/YqjD/DUF883 family membrane-anchored ribosome-binding protein